MPTLFLGLLGLGLAFVVSAIAAVTDARTGRIPNVLTLPAAACGIVLHAALGGTREAVTSFAGLLLSGLVPWLLYRSTRGRAIGGGDVKLFAALGALVGPSPGLEIELAAFVALSLFAMIRLTFRGELLRLLKNVVLVGVRPLVPRERRRPLDSLAMTELRMGPAIFAGVAAVIVADHAARWAPWLV